MAGILSKKYHDERKKRIDLIYRLNRRTYEVKKIIEKNFDASCYKKLNCLDIGTADGLMLSKLNNAFEFNKAIGIDMSKELIRTNKDKNIELKIGNAENLQFNNCAFDIIIACAVIEHVDNPHCMLSECYRVLKQDGLLILTAPNPFYDELATKIKYFKDEDHVDAFTIKKLKGMFEVNNFKVIYSKYFMFFPLFKLPLENQIESFIRFIKLGKVMTNQLVVGKKHGDKK